MVKDLTHGFSRDLIIHPGESLEEMLYEKNMTQAELSVRTGASEKHVSSIIRGHSPISVSYAKKLEYALGIDAGFWLNLQLNHDKELLEFEEVNGITKEELAVLRNIKDVIPFLKTNNMIPSQSDEVSTVLALRKFLAVSNLAAIPNLAKNTIFRTRHTHNIHVDDYVLYTWLRICEVQAATVKVAGMPDKKLLAEKLPEIKKIILLSPEKIQAELTHIFSLCGIAFCVVKHFQGAPVQGFIKNIQADRLILCMTLRQAFADIFWFTLFHEVGHVLHGDIKGQFVDYDSEKTDIEGNADAFARDILLNPLDYKTFVSSAEFSLSSIKKFAESQQVEPFIVIGRLQKEGYLEYSDYPKEKVRYNWIA